MIELKQKQIIIAIFFTIALLLAGSCCAAECPAEFDHYLKFYQVRYGYDLGTPLPENLVEFALGDYDPYGDIETYMYATVTNIYGHQRLYRGTAGPPSCASCPYEYFTQYLAALSETEALNLFEAGNNYIEQDKIQRADIEKIHQELSPGEPPLYYGVLLDEKGNPVLDESGKGIPEFKPDNPQNPNDVNYSYYQQGKTIVIPASYGLDPAYNRTRFFFNLNNAAVREYLVRYMLKRTSENKAGRNLLFLDNMGVFTQQVKESNDWYDKDVYYISGGISMEQAQTLVDHQISILEEIKRRNTEIKIIINGLRDKDVLKIKLFETLRDRQKLDLIEGFFLEITWWADNYCNNIEFYRKWIELANKANNKKILFAATDWDGQYDFSANSPTITKIWLWLHLVAENNVYSYINPKYHTPMTDYPAYDYPLGLALGPPQKDGKVWSREYERGTIVFDTTSGKLDAIEFIENECTMQCGNTICETGETFETCPEDCQECVDNEKLVGDYIPKWKRGEISMLVLMQKIVARNAGTGCPTPP
jgi:hypothetical protein